MLSICWGACSQRFARGSDLFWLACLLRHTQLNCFSSIAMPPKDKSVVVGGGMAAGMLTASPMSPPPISDTIPLNCLSSIAILPKGKSNAVGGGMPGDIVTASPMSPPPISDMASHLLRGTSAVVSDFDSSQSVSESGSSESIKRSAPVMCDSSPKRMIRNIVNVSISDWLERCPEGSAPGLTGSGSTYAVIIDMGPCSTVTTKKDCRKVAKKTILISDCSNKQAEITIWGNFAARSWTFPEGSVLLFKNLIFTTYYKNVLQLKFAEADSAHELLITKAPDSLDITKQLRTWWVYNNV